MKPELKHHTLKVLKFLKNYQNFDNLTLAQIQERVTELESLLIEFVETVLEDKEDMNGTLTTWWLFERVSKVLYQDGFPADNVESPEDFIDYMINKNDKT